MNSFHRQQYGDYMTSHALVADNSNGHAADGTEKAVPCFFKSPSMDMKSSARKAMATK